MTTFIRPLLSGAVALVVSAALVGGPQNANAAEEVPTTTKIPACADPSITKTSTNRYMFCSSGFVYTSGANELDWPNERTVALSEANMAPRACDIRWGLSVMRRDAAVDPWVMVYSSNLLVNGRCDSGRRCLYVATAANPEGPYRTPSDNPSGMLACDSGVNTYSGQFYRAQGGGAWVVARRDNRIAAHRVAAGLTSLGDGSWVDTGLEKDRDWENVNNNLGPAPIESPAMTQLPTGYWVMFYSAGKYSTAQYGQGYVVCGTGDRPTFPCHKPADNKLVGSHVKSFGLATGGAYHNAAGNPVMYVSGWYGDGSCSPNCADGTRSRYTRIFNLTGYNASPPNNLSVKLPVLQ